MIRLFIGLPLTITVEEKLSEIISDFKSKGGKIKFVEPKNIHLTLKFLGNTEYETVDEIKKRIDTIGRSYSSIETELSHIGGFPNLKQPRVIWVGLNKQIEIIEKLASDIETSMEDLGWEKIPKKFRSHLTLGRVKDQNEIFKLINYLKDYQFSPIPLTLDRIVLFQSTLTQQGPIYKRLHEVELSERFS